MFLSAPYPALSMANDLLKRLGIARDPRLLAPSTKTATLLAEGKAVDSLEPATGKVLGTVKLDTAKDYERAVKAAMPATPAAPTAPAAPAAAPAAPAAPKQN